MSKVWKFMTVFLMTAIAVTFVFSACAPQEELHTCGHVCEICGKCTDKDCEEKECEEKCKGHSLLTVSKDDGTDGDICYHSCSVCGKCTDPYSFTEVCSEKCECDGATRLYRREAETTVCNGNPNQGGAGLIIASDALNEGFSGGYQIEGTDLISTSDGIYFKWSITAESDCEAKLNIGGAGLAGTIENKDKFALYVDGRAYEIKTRSTWGGFERLSQELVTFELKAGQNTVRLFLLGDGSILNIDYFDFVIEGKATFNECSLDESKFYSHSYVTEAEDAVTNGTFTETEGMIGGLEEVKTEDAVYFKWSVTADEACEITLALYGAGSESINLSDKFYLALNGNPVKFDTVGRWTDDKISVCDLATFDIKKGENTIFLFVLGNSQRLKLDKFVFGSDKELTFNEVTTDGEVPEIKITRTYIQEAETTVTNGLNGGGLTLNGDGTKVENFSGVKTEDGVYFKWSVTAESDCKVTLSVLADGITAVDFGDRFLLKVGETEIVPTGSGAFSGFVPMKAEVAEFNLKAGEQTTIYLYVLTDEAGDHYINIDKFIFEAESEITFGETELDPVPHTCESVCKYCGKCTNAECGEEACKEKCAGHGVQTYEKEAETTVTNGLNGGGLTLNGDGTKVEGFSGVKTEDGVYFKWSVTAESDCKVTLSVLADGITAVDFGDRFLLKVGETEIVPTGSGAFSGFVPMKAEVAEFNLKAGEQTTIYLYVLTDEAGDHYINIDKFIFEAESEITFGEIAVDENNDQQVRS